VTSSFTTSKRGRKKAFRLQLNQLLIAFIANTNQIAIIDVGNRMAMRRARVTYQNSTAMAHYLSKCNKFKQKNGTKEQTNVDNDVVD
jgi:hypothetical protein